jgi:hypothetical protein
MIEEEQLRLLHTGTGESTDKKLRLGEREKLQRLPRKISLN